MTEARVILVTFPDLESGKKVTRELLNRSLIQCVNLLSGATSLYVWKGEVQEEGEVVGIMKTTSERVDELEVVFCERHPYDVPEFLVLPVEGGSAAYLKWLDQRTS